MKSKKPEKLQLGAVIGKSRNAVPLLRGSPKRTALHYLHARGW